MIQILIETIIGSPYVVVANVHDYDILVREFEL